MRELLLGREDLRRSQDRAASAEMHLMKAVQGGAQIFVLYGPDDRLVMYNHAYREANDKVMASIALGSLWEDNIRMAVDAGMVEDAIGREQDWLRERLARHRNPSGAFQENLADGRKLLVQEERLKDGSTITTTVDITEPMESEEHFRRAFEQIAVGCLVAPTDGTIEMFNSAGQRMFGYAPEEILGRSVATLLPEAADEQHLGEFERFVASGEEIPGVDRELSGVRKDGQAFPVNVGMGTMDIAGRRRFVASLVSVRDASVAGAASGGPERMESIGHLTGGLAHDFNNLMTTIVGSAEILSSRLEGGDASMRFLSAITDAVERGSSLTRRMLAFARRQDLKPEAVDVAGLINGLHALLRRTLGENLELRVVVDIDLWPVLLDRGEFENALINIAVNARDAMAGSGVLSVCAFNEHREASHGDGRVPLGDYVTITAKDNGSGISEAIVEYVFEPFFSTKDTGRGSGLGLSMVYGFVKQSGGFVTIDSSGRGHPGFDVLSADRGSASRARAFCRPVS
jgi:PAS domain S-box-containing protein